jgi:hypothetical protein
MGVVLAGLCVREDLWGVTSLVRALGLEAVCYDRLLDFFHSPALDVEMLTRLWTALVVDLHPGLVLCNGRRVLVGDGIGPRVAANGWLVLAPVAHARSSYSPLLFLLLVAASCALASVLVHRLYHGRLRRAAPWDCGYPRLNARMQDTAEGFGQPIRQVFEPFFRIERHLPTPFDRHPSYFLSATDRIWHWVYVPIARAVDGTSRLVGLLQQGRIATYLTYSFVTLLVMLFLVFR